MRFFEDGMEKRYFKSIFGIELPDLNFDGFNIFICKIIITSVTVILDSLFTFLLKHFTLQDYNFKLIWR